ncbi:hypothetical protein BV898_12071 [Hypsibius exemplaris]|uniref:Transmembrane protein 192 n=1 Tax=Hypsibius exemplaris TaxID=2072580 RepID=A0A1W0WET2_HYPEX|nr:hypothetical protein BV898_12071 [Hypsibius exemplaris]
MTIEASITMAGELGCPHSRVDPDSTKQLDDARAHPDNAVTPIPSEMFPIIQEDMIMSLIHRCAIGFSVLLIICIWLKDPTNDVMLTMLGCCTWELVDVVLATVFLFKCPSELPQNGIHTVAWMKTQRYCRRLIHAHLIVNITAGLTALFAFKCSFGLPASNDDEKVARMTIAILLGVFILVQCYHLVLTSIHSMAWLAEWDYLIRDRIATTKTGQPTDGGTVDPDVEANGKMDPAQSPISGKRKVLGSLKKKKKEKNHQISQTPPVLPKNEDAPKTLLQTGTSVCASGVTVPQTCTLFRLPTSEPPPTLKFNEDELVAFEEVSPDEEGGVVGREDAELPAEEWRVTVR